MQILFSAAQPFQNNAIKAQTVAYKPTVNMAATDTISIQFGKDKDGYTPRQQRANRALDAANAVEKATRGKGSSIHGPAVEKQQAAIRETQAADTEAAQSP